MTMKAQKRTLVLLTPELAEIDRLEFPADYGEPPISADDLTHLRHYVAGEKYSGGEAKRQEALAAVDFERYRISNGRTVYDGPGLNPEALKAATLIATFGETSMDAQQILAEIEQLGHQRQDLIQQSEQLMQQAQQIETQQKELGDRARQQFEEQIQAAQQRIEQAQDSLAQLDTCLTVA
ncbi:MAG: hypothetical protein AAF704_02190 [Cyanobacteria bacterium P01_D01_bin.123]